MRFAAAVFAALMLFSVAHAADDSRKVIATDEKFPLARASVTPGITGYSLVGSEPLFPPASPDVTSVAVSGFMCFATDSEARAGKPSIDCGALIRGAASHFTRCGNAIDREKLARCTVEKESSRKMRTVGSAGEISLVQIKPGTFSDMRIAYPWLGLSDIWDAGDNLEAGMAYQDYLMGLGYIGCNVDNVIHAYNVGQGAFRAGRRNPAYHDDIAGCYYA